MTVPIEPVCQEDLRFPLLGLDVSETKIGLALLDNPQSVSQPLFTYHRITRARDIAQCAEWVQRYGVQGIVLGLPLNMDGTSGPRAQWMQRFGRELRERCAVPVFWQDERLSTVEADECLLAQGYGWDTRRERIDAVAAAIILDRFIRTCEERA